MLPIKHKNSQAIKWNPSPTTPKARLILPCKCRLTKFVLCKHNLLLGRKKPWETLLFSAEQPYFQFVICRISQPTSVTRPSVVSTQGRSGSETLCGGPSLPSSGNWQWDNWWRDVFFTTPRVCREKRKGGSEWGQSWDGWISTFGPAQGGLWFVFYFQPKLGDDRSHDSLVISVLCIVSKKIYSYL